MSLRIVEHAGLTDVGRQRQSNEDRFVERPPFFAVADGMGGARGGEVASKLAVDAFDGIDDGGPDPEEQLARIARAANRRIHDLARSDERRAGMGTTFSAVMVGDRELAVAHVGDSRVYRLRDGELERLTTDHSLVEEWVRAGRLTPEEAEHHPQRSIITRALGPESEVEVETCTYELQDGDRFLLCSDGLTGMISEDEIVSVLEHTGTLAEAAQDLVAAANRAGGRDNITVVLVRVGRDGDRAVAPDDDTLSGRATEVGGLSAAEVRDAVATPAGDRQTAAGDGGRAGPAPDETAVIDARTARSALDAPPAASPPRPRSARRTPARAEEPPAGALPAPRRRRGRRLLAALAALLAVAALAVAAVLAGRQVYFVGTSERGLVTLYRGFPYELPLGIDLYSTEYESTVPAANLPARQRQAILDHELHDRTDAADLIRQLEQGRTEP